MRLDIATVERILNRETTFKDIAAERGVSHSTVRISFFEFLRKYTSYKYKRSDPLLDARNHKEQLLEELRNAKIDDVDLESIKSAISFLQKNGYDVRKR